MIYEWPRKNWRRGSKSPLSSAPAAAFQDVVPPFFFQGCWESIDSVAGWALHYTYFVPWQRQLQISAKYDTFFLYVSKISWTYLALPLVIRGGYVVIWHRTNVSSWFLPCDIYKTRKTDLAITLLTPYPAGSEAYLHKLNVAPSWLGLSWSWERTVAVACVQWNWDIQKNLIPSTLNNSLSRCLLLQNILAWYKSSTYHEVFD